MNNQKVLIVVSGGVVQSVFSNDSNIQIDLLDFDNLEFDSDNDAKIEFEQRKNDLIEICY